MVKVGGELRGGEGWLDQATTLSCPRFFLPLLPDWPGSNQYLAESNVMEAWTGLDGSHLGICQE